MSEFMIRESTKDDIDRIMQIWYESSLDTYDFIGKRHWDDMKEKVRDKFLNSNILLYKENNIIKGFILVEQGYIDELYVDKKYRGNGIGKSLLDFVKKENNELILNVFQKNTEAIRFYKRNDFEIIEENFEDYTKEKGYLMKWKR